MRTGKGTATTGRRVAVAAFLLALVPSLAACGEQEAGSPVPSGECRSLQIVATTSILGDIVGGLTLEGDRVQVLMPIGADPHSFQASASQAAALRRADLVVANGLGLEEGLHRVVEEAAAEGVVVLEAASFVEPLPFAPTAESDLHGADTPEAEAAAGGADEDHAPGTLDPHIWTDPARLAEVATGLGEALAAADPACAAPRRAAAAAYRRQLEALDAEIAGILAAVPPESRKLVTSHHAFGYFADRYGFRVVGIIIPGGSTLAEPSPADLASLVETLRQEGVRVIFAETTRPADLAAAVAGELGEEVQVVTLYSGSLGEPGSGAETYLDMQRTNAERIAAALSP